jgi:hypothetical protein
MMSYREFGCVCGMDSLWKLALLVVMLMVFACIGIGSLFNPDWGIKHFGESLRRGGELQTESNRVGISFVGLVVGGLALGLLYDVLRGCF